MEAWWTTAAAGSALFPNPRPAPKEASGADKAAVRYATAGAADWTTAGVAWWTTAGAAATVNWGAENTGACRTTVAAGAGADKNCFTCKEAGDAAKAGAAKVWPKPRPAPNVAKGAAKAAVRYETAGAAWGTTAGAVAATVTCGTLNTGAAGAWCTTARAGAATICLTSGACWTTAVAGAGALTNSLT